MFTIFACPKAFTNHHIATIQRNALASWLRLDPKPEILLFGYDEGIAELCREMDVRHLPHVECNAMGTPLISDLFARAQREARYDVLCYVNADIILTSDLTAGISNVHGKFHRFLMSGQRWGLYQDDALAFGDDWEPALRRRVYQLNDLHRPDAIDYFAFSRNLFKDLPAFAVGRPLWDNWMIGHALRLRVPFVDATSAVMVVHQAHDYAHVQGWENYARGPEAQRNRQLVPRGSALANLQDATHVLSISGIHSAWFRRTKYRVSRVPQRCRSGVKAILNGARQALVRLAGRAFGPSAAEKIDHLCQRLLPARMKR